MKPQTDRSHYDESYYERRRLYSVAVQAEVLRELAPASVIEIGPGRGVFAAMFRQLSGARVLHLVADGDLAAGFEQSGDVAAGGVIGNAAHGHGAAVGERDVEQSRSVLCVLEKQLVKIPEAEEQQRVAGQFVFDAPILRHHRSELGVAAHRAES